MNRVLVIGSGASAVHFALRALDKGHAVTMIDVGNRRPAAVAPTLTFNQLKSDLPDPADYFLGDDYYGVLYPGAKGEYYGFPPSKRFVFEQPDAWNVRSHGFQPLASFARGGLAETWTGGCYPLNQHELADFGIPFDDMRRYYAEVAHEIGVVGVRDDLERFFPAHDHLLPGLRLDEHSRRLVERYERVRHRLNADHRAFVGRSRVATLSVDKDDRKACSYSGRCLWGCPSRSLYTPSITLEKCRQHPRFTYVPGMFVTHFEYDARNRVTAVVARPIDGGHPERFPADRLVLAAGTLSSSRIFMESIRRASGQTVKLTGLMDNRQVLLPYLNLSMIGRPFEAESYQYHQLALGIESEKPEEFVHCQITALKTALVHPIIQSLPLDLKTSAFIFRNVRAGLGVVNINLHDRRRETNYLTLAAPDNANAADATAKLEIHYAPPAGEDARLKSVIRTVKKCLRKLGCFAPPGMTHVRPMGASVHYAGTIPISATPGQFTASTNCRSHDFDNLYFVDGTTFPFLPAKNLTFTLMANATRVADLEF
jgi:choline dehydrogenase-like flavoprotein